MSATGLRMKHKKINAGLISENDLTVAEIWALHDYYGHPIVGCKCPQCNKELKQ